MGFLFAGLAFVFKRISAITTLLFSLMIARVYKTFTESLVGLTFHIVLRKF